MLPLKILVFWLKLYPFGLAMMLAWLASMLLNIAVLPIVLMAQAGEPLTSLTEKYGIFGTVIAGQFIMMGFLWRALQKERDARITDLNQYKAELIMGFGKIATSLDQFSIVMRQAIEIVSAPRARDGR